MMPFWHIFPWALAAIGTAAFAVLLSRHRRIAARHRVAEAELVESNDTLNRIRQAMGSATDAIGIGDFDGNSLYHNRSWMNLFGYTVDELNAVPGQGVLFADEEVAKVVYEHINAGRSWAGEADIRTKDGRRIPAAIRTDVVLDEKGYPVGIFGIFRDITLERQRAREAERATKLESIGMAASGIAHDFNNLLAVIIGQVNLAQLDDHLTESVRSRLAEVERVTWRARDLSNQLKTFVKGETPMMKLLHLPPIVREAVDFAVRSPAVEVRFAVPEELWPVNADASQLVQVINNLAVNAVQAMPQGGTLSVLAENLPAGDPRGLPSRAAVLVLVGDTGVGIPPENLAKIFEPFFTTKEEGTGLGLATTRSIVSKHGGQLRVESEVGRGTRISVVLPAAAARSAAAPQPENVVSKSA
jgi:PAS domain S-box-containing protein